MTATITAVAHYVPPDIYPNSFFEKYLDTTDEWIISRSGISERRFSKNGATSGLIIPAAKKCLEQRGIGPEEIDCIIVATVTPDHFFPATAAIVQRELGIKKAWGFDLSAACSGFVFALVTAAKLIESGISKKLLLCGGDKMSSILDFNDRTQAVLFGDGAGVVLLEQSDDPELGILDQILLIDGEGESALHMVAGGSHKPSTKETVENNEHYIVQDGQAVFKAAVVGMADVSLEIMNKNNLTSDDVAWLVPHQANLRIINATANRMGLGLDKVMINIDKYGNTTAGTIPICLSEWYTAGKIKKGDRLIISSFGAGYTWGAVYLRWNMNN
ncbi:MAG: beta-ketoacyl-ACP synthase III [FCB group bacterium]|jgi:3-oxoacyl-[acyl-carrier-protein] synthase-3